jgi:hypothetical protein
MSEVFISYAHADRELARAIAGQLTASGADVWWDRELIAGDDFDSALLERASVAKCIVVIWTPDSIISRYVRDEARIAVEHDRLIPVARSGVQPPLGFRTFHLIEFGPSGLDSEFVRKLVSAVEERIDRKLKQPGRSTAGRESRVYVPWILSVAVDLAHSIVDEFDRATALADIANVMAVTDPGRAALLATEAERIARTIASQSKRGRDAKIANRVDSTRARALARVAKAVAVTDPARAARLVAEAERIARSVTMYPWGRTLALFDAAKAMAAIDPYKAEHIARSIDDEFVRAQAFAKVAKAMAVTDPGRAALLAAEAERDIQTIPGPFFKVQVLADVAVVAAATDRPRAVQILKDAERIARATTYDGHRASEFTFVAKAMLAIDPDRAAVLAAEAERIAYAITDTRAKAEVFADVAKVIAAINPDRAERITQAITHNLYKVEALVTIAAVSSTQL